MTVSGGARPRGRRPAGEDTRAAILAAARTEFAARGFDAASVRAIARSAGVDPALVRHYFETKPDLYIASLVPGGIDPVQVVSAALAGPVDGIGERLVLTFLRVWDSEEGRVQLRLVFGGLLSADPQMEHFPAYLRQQVLGVVKAALPGPDGELRISLVASQMSGLFTARVLLGVEPLASMPHAEVAALVGPTIQRYLTGPLPASQ